MKIAIIGLGLIGGSLAKAFSKYTNHTIVGVDLSDASLKAALECKAIETAFKETPLADIYFLAMSPNITLEYIKNNAKLMQKGAIVTDVCGVKEYISDIAEKICLENGLKFVGGHPMAGREVSGFENSVADLFKNRSYIITSTDKTEKEAVEVLEKLVLSIGIDNITYTSPKEHDEIIAFTSQLPHILAGAYMKSPASRKHKGFSAGSYHDVSRVSSVDEALWSELFLINKENIKTELEVLIENLNCYLKAITKENKAELYDLIKESRILKETDLKTNGGEKPHKFG